MAEHHSLIALHDAGQSAWIDNISRGMVRHGRLARLIAQGVRGVTSNPTIFQKAVSGSTDYNAAISQIPACLLASLFDFKPTQAL